MALHSRPRIVIVSSSGIPRERIVAMAPEIPEADIVITDDTYESIAAVMSGAHALIGCPRPLFRKEILESARDTLRWIHVPGAGCDEFLIPELIKSDIILTNGKIIQGPEVADHALALLLALTRNIARVARGQTDGMPRPVELRGKTALVVGVGGVGMLIAERASAFGMHVIGVDTEYVPFVRALAETHLIERLNDLLPSADVVFVATPLTVMTLKRWGADEFARMKRGVYFVNVSRGKVVDTEALLRALQDGIIGGAGLDVTDPEPLPTDHPLRFIPNVLLTPHIAGPSDKNRERSFELITQNIRRFVSGKPLLNIVNKTLGY